MALMGEGRLRRQHWPLGQQEATARWKCSSLLQLSALFNVNSVKDCESVWCGSGSAFPAFNIGNLVTVHIVISSWAFCTQKELEKIQEEEHLHMQTTANLTLSILIFYVIIHLVPHPIACFCPQGLHSLWSEHQIPVLQNDLGFGKAFEKDAIAAFPLRPWDG